jgi:hypothetical protein
VQLEPDELRRLIAGGEGKNLEFKRGLPGAAKVARTLCAFANTRGGLLLIGVGDRGELVGAPRPRETMQALRSVAQDGLEPPLAVELGSLELEGRRIVWCSVPLSPRRPHAALDERGPGRTGRVLVRVGASNRAASGASLRAIQDQRTAGRSLEPLERDVLRWVAMRMRGRADPAGDATVAGFARAHNVGLQRARRAFTRLELAGRLVGHGAGARRVYGLP